jgi:hypothetical protein
MTALGALSNTLWRVLLGVAVLCTLPAPASRAQGDEVGVIEEIQREGREVPSTADILLTATPAYTRKPASRSDALHVREIVELLEPYYLRATLRYGGVRSTLYAGSSGVEIDTVELQRRGAYEILPNRVDRLSGLELRIRHGVLVVEHAAGRLDAWVDSTLTRIFGTTVLFAVDSTSADAFLFLREGHIAFPAYDIEFTGQDAAWRLRDGVAPELVSLGVAEWQQLRREVEFLSDDLWHASRPFYQRPSFYVPAAVAVAGGALVAVLLLSGGDDGGGPVVGDAVIRIPD